MILRASFFILLSFFSLSLWAESYSRGQYTCEDFSLAKENYENHPKNIPYTAIYAICLVLKGEDTKGMHLFHHLADEYNHVFSAFFIAHYIKSHGDLTSEVKFWENEKLIDKAITAYERTLHFIKMDPDYSHRLSERYHQMEIRSYFNIAFLYFTRFKVGFWALESLYLLRSPSYQGDRNLNTYPEYNIYTEESLKEMRDSAEACISLPQKKHFDISIYNKAQSLCQNYKEIAKALIPLEREKLRLLNDESCAYDLPNCTAYWKLKQQMQNIAGMRL